ncbi:MAG: choice-of-anchor Q domain-containing protein [Anaerolineae bacterium]
MAHNTFVDNLEGDGVGVHVDTGSTVLLYNNIVVGRSVGITNADIDGSSVEADYTLFEGNGMDYGPGVDSSYEIPGPAMLLTDYHLGSGSGAMNTAVTLPWVTRDIDGDRRPIGTGCDIGADEYVAHVCVPLALRGR